jgi:predicted nuclease with TOPRIM domain
LLISQFAVLASRLGITLPCDVLSSLSSQANAIDTCNGEQASYHQSLQALSNLIHAQAQKGSPVPPTSSDEAGSSPEKADAPSSSHVNAAEAAVTSASESRKRAQSEANYGPKPPLYSKRRKKPRLADCESKLASLKAENEMLKRHVDTITNRSKKVDEERKAQEQEMKRLMNEGAGPEQLNPLLSKFSEVYSDYGDNRHQELTFHLQQLQRYVVLDFMISTSYCAHILVRLVAPTNFTKMGLWTLGQNERFYTDIKRNPIAGILREELRITSQQGRKILEQSQKIRDLSENLKECLRLLGKLKSICEHKQKVFSDRMSKCQEILTPLQVVKLLLWVDDNSNILESTVSRRAVVNGIPGQSTNGTLVFVHYHSAVPWVGI